MYFLMDSYLCDGEKRIWQRSDTNIGMLHQAVSWDAGVARGTIKALEKESALSHPSPSLWAYLCLSSSFPFDHFTFLSIFERRQGEKGWVNCQINLIFCFIVPLTVWEQIESFRIMGKKESLGSVIDSHDIWPILCSFRKLNSSWM